MRFFQRAVEVGRESSNVVGVAFLLNDIGKMLGGIAIMIFRHSFSKGVSTSGGRIGGDRLSFTAQ